MKHVIIGAGEAGLRAALALKAAGERDIVLLNGESLATYERPALSKPQADGSFQKPIAADLTGIDLRHATPVSDIDRNGRLVLLPSGERLAYDRLLLATGARPRRLSFRDAVIHELRTLEDAGKIYAAARSGRHAVVIGAGLIGLEMAAELVRRGMTVTVVEGGPRALGRAVPASLASVIVNRHIEAGVRLQFGQTIAGISDQTVTLGDGTRLAADLLIAAIGVEPNVELAARAGLACNNGILTNAQLRTADDVIFAAGDCAAVDHARYGVVRLETWRNAVDQGGFAAMAMLGSTAPFAALPWFWSDHYDLGLQGVGMHKPERPAIRRDLPGGGFLQFERDEAGVLQAAFGIGPGNAVAKDIKLAEKLIEKHAMIAPEQLADPGYALKSALKSG